MAAVQASRASVSKPSLACTRIARRTTVKCLAQKENAFQQMGQKLATAGSAALLTMGTLSGMPAVASEFDILAEPTPTNVFYVDDANVLSKATKSEINQKLKNLEITTGYHVEVVTVRRLEVETDSYAYADKVLGTWYPKDADKKGVLLVVTASKEGALAGGAAFQDAVGEELADSITGENIAIFTEQERYNECVTSSVTRLVAKINGEEVPEAPKRVEVERKRTYKTKEETENSRGVTATIVGTLLFIACVVPMLQYYGYTARD